MRDDDAFPNSRAVTEAINRDSFCALEAANKAEPHSQKTIRFAEVLTEPLGEAKKVPLMNPWGTPIDMIQVLDIFDENMHKHDQVALQDSISIENTFQDDSDQDFFISDDEESSMSNQVLCAIGVVGFSALRGWTAQKFCTSLIKRSAIRTMKQVLGT